MTDSDSAAATRDTWTRWFVPVLAFIQQHDVRVWAYIDCAWDSLSMYAGQRWGDSRLEGILRNYAIYVFTDLTENVGDRASADEQALAVGSVAVQQIHSLV